MFFVWFLMLAIAINQLSRILTTVDLLEDARNWFTAKFPRIGKLAVCIFCQSFWLSGIASIFLFGLWPVEASLIVQHLVGWFGLHWTVEMIQEFKERYLNRAPSTVYAKIDHQRISNSAESDVTE